MIKIFGLGARRADMTPESFHDHYRHPHGTLGLTVSTVERYVQSHQIHSDLLPISQARFESVAELWVAGEDAVVRFREDPNLVRHILPDEPKFADMSRSQFLVTQEEALDCSPAFRTEVDQLWSPDNRPLSIKLIQLIDRNEHWVGEKDAALGVALSALRHVRCLPVAAFLTEGQEFHGVRELWWPTLSAFRAGVAAAREALDELLFTKGPSVTLLAQAERFL